MDESNNNDIKKPPLGIMPRFLHVEHRLVDIEMAMQRCITARHPIPLEWVVEYNDLLSSSKESYARSDEKSRDTYVLYEISKPRQDCKHTRY